MRVKKPADSAKFSLNRLTKPAVYDKQQLHTVMKLYHCADIHLGQRRLDGRLPDQDFADAFGHVAQAAIRGKADLLLLAGDLFDRPQVEPPHLRQAQGVLERLKAAGVPVIAIEGNHDKAFINSSEPTWLNYLADDDLLVLLTIRFNAEGPILIPWDPTTKVGSWVDVNGIRFVGAGYLGAATPHKVRQIVQKLEPASTHVLLLHAGPDYFVGEGGGFSTQDLELIHDKVCYLALGHIHKPMIHGDWACNPGSPENCGLREARYDRDSAGNPCPRGYAVVEISPASKAKPESLEIHSTPRRPCVQLTLDCTPFGNQLQDGAAAMEKAACQLIQEQSLPPHAAVDLKLIGSVNLNRIAFDLQGLERNIEQATQILALGIDASGINLGPAAGSGPEQEMASREEIERSAIRTLVEVEHLRGLEGEQEAVANLFFDLKEAVRANKSADELADRIRTSPLVERIRLASTAASAEPAAAAPGSAKRARRSP